MEENTIKEKYQELINYISQIGYESFIRYESQVEVYIILSDYCKKEFMEIHLFQPINDKKAYHFKKLRIDWRIFPDKYLNNSHWFDEDIDQMVIYNTLLFDIIKWKIEKIGEVNVDDSNIFMYEVMNSWLKTREKQTVTEEKIKIQNHLSMEEFREVIKDELGKVSINLKIGDK